MVVQMNVFAVWALRLGRKYKISVAQTLRHLRRATLVALHCVNTDAPFFAYSWKLPAYS